MGRPGSKHSRLSTSLRAATVTQAWAAVASAGATLIASDTRITLNGHVEASGGNGVGGGSGGAISIVSPVITGTGTFYVNGGSGYGVSGSQNRVRIDCGDRYAFRSLRVQGRVTSAVTSRSSFPSPFTSANTAPVEAWLVQVTLLRRLQHW